MSVRTGRGLAAGLAVVGVVIGAASLAWACSIQASMSVTPGKGVASSAVWVSGSGFGNSPVEIRWNGASGQQIGSAMGPSFNVRVTIPNVAPRVYTVLAMQTAPLGSTQRASFHVTSQPAPPVTGGNQGTGTEGSGTDGSGTDGSETEESGTQATGTEGSGTPSNSEGTSTGSGSTSTGSGTSTGSTGLSTQGAVDVNSSPDPGVAYPATAGASGRGSNAAPSSARSAASSPIPLAGTAASPAAPAANSTASVPAETEAQPAARSVAGDLWSGFAPGSSTGTSLLDGGASDGQGLPMAMGVGLLSAGIVALGLGFSAAELRRRRGHVQSASTGR